VKGVIIIMSHSNEIITSLFRGNCSMKLSMNESGSKNVLWHSFLNNKLLHQIMMQEVNLSMKKKLVEDDVFIILRKSYFPLSRLRFSPNKSSWIPMHFPDVLPSLTSLLVGDTTSTSTHQHRTFFSSSSKKDSNFKFCSRTQIPDPLGLLHKNSAI
jgi:hypothetical protein